MNHPFYDDDTKVNLATEEVLSKGTSILQIWKRGATDAEHCKWLLEKAMFPQDATVLDVACGVGAVALGMHAIRPDLHFTLQNLSHSQLQKCPTTWDKYWCDMNSLGMVPDHSFDSAMVCYALGHVDDLHIFLKNVARVLKPNGLFFIYDLQALPGNEGWALNELEYTTYTTEQLVKVVSATKLFHIVHEYDLNPRDFNVDEFTRVCGANMGREVSVRTKPVCYRLIRSASTPASR